MQNQPLSFGAIIRQPDIRDYPLGAFTPTTYPDTYFADISWAPVENQQKLPVCSAFAGSFLKNIQDNRRLSPAYLWKKIKQIDGYPPESGTDMLAIFKTLNKTGVCEYGQGIDNSSVDLATYTDPSSITMAMSADAQDHRIDTYAFQFNPTIEQIKAAIYEHKVVIALLRIGTEFYTPSWAAKDILPLRPPQSIIGGHFIVLYGYDKENIYFRNEWSSAWGANGNGYFNSSYLPYVVEIGTAVDTSGGRFQQDLSYGMANLDVYSLQKFLVKNGFGTYTPTGFFGDKTRSSVIAFQKKYGISQTGYFGPISRGQANILYAQTM